MKHAKSAGRRKKALLLAAVCILVLAFIFTRSLKSVEDSSEESGRILRLIHPVLALVVGEDNVTQHLVRKLAHFIEFAVLGISLAGLTAVMTVSPLWVLFGTLISALTDETLQLFSARGSQVQDVWLDFSGAVSGAALFLLLRWLFRRIRRRKS